MTYEELAVLQYGRSKSFSEAQVEAMAAYCQAEHDLKQLQQENAKLRELVRDMWNEGMCECGSRGKCARCEYGYPDRMRELGVEVDG